MILKVLLPHKSEAPEPIALLRNEDSSVFLKMKWTYEVQEKFGRESGYYKVEVKFDVCRILERAPEEFW